MSEEHRRGSDEEAGSGDDQHRPDPHSSTWVGAFERVMGEPGEHTHIRPHTPSRPRSRTLSRRSIHSGDSSLEVIPPPRSATASPFRIVDNGSASTTASHTRTRSGSLGTQPDDGAVSSMLSVPGRSLSSSAAAAAAAASRKARLLSGPHLISVGQMDSIVLEDCYLNHAASMLPVRVQNTSLDQRVLLRIGSDMGRSLTFLKRKKVAAETKERIVYPTNAVQWAKEDGLHPNKLREIRHLVANLQSADLLILEPGAEEDVFVQFRPAEDEQARRLLVPQSPSPDSEKHHTEDSATLHSTNTMEGSLSPRSVPEISHTISTDGAGLLHRSVDVHGTITLRASKLPKAEMSAEEGNSLDPISSSASNMSSSSSSRPPSFYGSNFSSTTSASASMAYNSMGNQSDVQEIELPFSANYCRPQLGATKHQHRHKLHHSGAITLDFGDIFVGQTLEMDIFLHNESQIDTFWQARFEDADNMLQTPPISLLDDEGPVEAVTSVDDHPYRPNLLRPSVTKRIKATLNPTESYRDYEQVITFTNMHNAGNSIRVVVRANMLGEARDDALSVLSGNVIDFGDCVGGHWTRQLLVLRNNCEQYLDVHFNMEKGIEATFQLAELAQRSNEEQQSADHEPPLLPGYGSSSLASTSESGGDSEWDAAASVSAMGPPSPSQVSDVFSPNASALAQELAKTPLAKPQIGSLFGEPPCLALTDEAKKKKDEAAGANEDDDVDASSVASQAGSLPGSPRVGPSHLPKGATLESTGRSEAVPMSDTASSEGGRANSNHSRPSSAIFSSRPPSRGLLSHLRGELDRPHTDEAASTRSDLTAISHDSRLGPFLSASSHHGGSQGSQAERSRYVRHAGAVALSGLAGVENAHGSQLEELILRPGAEYRVIVSYRPPRGQRSPDYTEGKLVVKTFGLLLDYARSKSSGVRTRGGRERKTVPCRIRTCTSFISVSPRTIDFGLANVGTKKASSFAVTNHSELTARVDLRFVSKVLSMYRDEISIPPLQTLELRVDFFPRRVNDNYRKQVTVANLLNRSNDEILEVRSKNIDEQKVSFHSLFYRILTSTGSNYLDFGDVNINCTRLRSFSIENMSKAKLILELSAAHPEDLKLYVKAESLQQKVPLQKGNRYAELEGAEEIPAATEGEEGIKAKTAKRRAKGQDLKERFLESLSQDIPARHENSSWRTAQKDSHYRKGAKSRNSQKKGEANEKKEMKKPPINLVSALKKGGKGRLTQRYGSSITFRDNKLLSEFECLDLATGPPIDGKRIPAKSKKYQMLDAIETGKNVSAKAAAKGAESSKQPGLPPASPAAKELVKKSGATDGSAPSSQSPTTTRSPALTGKRKTEITLHEAARVSHLTLDELVAAVEGQSSSLSTFFLGNPLAEEQSVRTEINLQRELQAAISSNRLVPIEALSIEEGQEQQVIAIYTPNGSTRPHIQGNARKQDSRIFLRLVDFRTDGVEDVDEFASLLRLDVDELPVRELMVKSNICRSILELSQPHINFGQMNKGDTKTRKILIQNRSEWALRFCIRKSGSISSGDIKLKNTDRYGVVPGHGKREVEFVFCPALTGAFQERLIVENVADRDKDETVYLKANVRKVSNFKVDPEVIEFSDALPLGQISSTELTFMLSNVSAKVRTFVVGVDEDDLRFQTMQVDVLLCSSNDGPAKAMLSKAEEEEVEHISQKLKIANRKGQADKIKKYEDRLSELGLLSSQTSSPLLGKSTLEEEQRDGKVDGDLPAPAPPAPSSSFNTTEEESQLKLKQVSSTVTLTLAASQSKKLLLRLRPIPRKTEVPFTPAWQHDSGEFSLNIRVHEMKNTDEVQTIEVRGRVQGPQPDAVFQQVAAPESPPSPGWIVFSAAPSTPPRQTPS